MFFKLFFIFGCILSLFYCEILAIHSSLIEKSNNIVHKNNIHMFWHSLEKIKPIISLSFKSALRTQQNANIILWTNEYKINPFILELLKFKCNSGSTFNIKTLKQLDDLIPTAPDPIIRTNCKPFGNNIFNPVGLSDRVRFLALYFYGGIYVDVDTVFLKDLSPFQGLSFGFKWDKNQKYYNTAIMGLQKYSPIVGNIIKKTGNCIPITFYPSKIHEKLGCTHSTPCKDFMMMPFNLFDPIQGGSTNDALERFPFPTGYSDKIFTEERILPLQHIFPGAFTYHWHNRWDIKIHKNSTISDLISLNSICDSPKQTPSSSSPILKKNEINKIKKRKIYVDLGGYKGDTLTLHTKYFLSPIDDGIKKEIYVFEVEPNNLVEIVSLLQNSLYHIKNYTQILPVAAWNEDGIQVFQPSRKKMNKNDGLLNPTATTGMKVVTYDIGKWFKQTIKPTIYDEILLKIDIEGAEVQTIESLNKWGILPFVNHLILEWHDWLFPNVKKEKPNLEKILISNGLNFKYATLDDKLHIKYKKGDKWPVKWCDSHYFREEEKK